MTKVIFQTSRKCCKNFNQREITHRQYEVELWFFYTALCIIATNTNAKFQVNQTGDNKVMLWTKSYSKELSNLKATNSNFSGLITPMITLIRDLGDIYFNKVWNYLVDICRCYSVNKVKYSNFSNSWANNSSCSGLITHIIDLTQDLMVMYIFTKFGDDWLIIVDARV